jgi:hypothetical protein
MQTYMHARLTINGGLVSIDADIVNFLLLLIHPKMTTQSNELLSRVLGNLPSTYASYSSQIYFHKYSTGQSPKFTTDFEQLQASAKTRLSAEAYDYAAGGAGTSRTMTANRDAFDKVVQPSLSYPHSC